MQDSSRFKKAPYIITVSPGYHDFTLWGALGSAAGGYYLPTKLENVYVKAGMAYQILYSIDYDDRVQYYFEEVGTISQYNDYLKNHPDHKSGYPVPPLTK